MSNEAEKSRLKAKIADAIEMEKACQRLVREDPKDNSRKEELRRATAQLQGLRHELNSIR